MRYCLLPIVLILTLLAGCSTRPVVPPESAPSSPIDIPDSWPEHVRQLTLLKDWQLKGKIGIRTQNNGGSAYLDWSQSEDSFHIQLSGPLGQGATIISGNPYGARLKNNEGEYLSESPEQLLMDHTGWDLPLSNLLYWVKGIPAPRGKPVMTYNEQGMLDTLQQNQWHLSFPRYQQTMNLWLPQRIVIHNQDLKVTLIIKTWQPIQAHNP